jgi:phage tail-like protein
VNGKFERKSGFILLLDREGNEKWRWFFERAYLVQWTGPELRADSNTVAVESIELVHKGLKKF